MKKLWMIANWLLVLSLLLSPTAYAETEVLCPQRYADGSRLIEGDVLRYQSGNRLKDGAVWRYEDGNRVVDGAIWRYQNGNRLVDGAVWRYEDGNRLLDGNIVRYQNGNRLREPDGTFRAENGTSIGGTFYSHLFNTSDSTSVRVELTKTTQQLIVILSDRGNTYELTYDPGKTSPSRVKCSISGSSGKARFAYIKLYL